MDATVKKIPYGISNFTELIDQNMYYVDKTTYIPLLEDQPNYLFLIRPRRFGKSLFLTMLRAYYDIAQKDKFADRFKGLYIGEHPTSLQGRYQVLYFDFSRAGSDFENLETNFDRYCNECLDNFAQMYASYYPAGFEQELKLRSNSGAKLNYLHLQAQTAGIPLYLIIDEYDNFTNIVLNEQGNKVYHAMTHASGFYREAFKKYKGMFERIFMMGVSPVMIEDFDISWNISMDYQFNMMLGFNEDEVRIMFQYYKNAEILQGDIDKMIAEAKQLCGNYCFAGKNLECGQLIFNSDMVLRYLHNRIYQNELKQTIDSDICTNIKRLIQMDCIDGGYRNDDFKKVVENGQIVSTVYAFPFVDQILKSELFISILLFYGMLTISGTKGARFILNIPNDNMRKLYDEIIDCNKWHKTQNCILS